MNFEKKLNLILEAELGQESEQYDWNARVEAAIKVYDQKYERITRSLVYLEPMDHDGCWSIWAVWATARALMLSMISWNQP